MIAFSQNGDRSIDVRRVNDIEMLDHCTECGRDYTATLIVRHDCGCYLKRLPMREALGSGVHWKPSQRRIGGWLLVGGAATLLAAFLATALGWRHALEGLLAVGVFTSMIAGGVHLLTKP